MRFSILGIVLAAMVLATLPSSLAQQPDDSRDAYRFIDQAKREAGSAQEQAAVLVQLAWANDEVGPRIASLAREQLVGYGKDSMLALRLAVRRINPVYRADATAALLEARLLVTSGQPEHYLPALEEAIWFGSADAKRLAIPEVARYRYPPALLTVIDAAYEYPELTEIVVQALANYRNDRARHFLNGVLREGDPRERTKAATALAQIGGRAVLTLKDAALDPDTAVRTSALDALIPIATPDELTVLYEFLGRYADDDTDTVQRVRDRIAQLEEFIDFQQEAKPGAQSED